jgi:hypothetical protein
MKEPPSTISSIPSEEYLMMCLLPAIPDFEIAQHIPIASHILPLIVRFTNDFIPLSCFSSTISCLLSTFSWKVNRNVDGTPECLAHNIVSLYDPNLPVKIILVDATHHIVVHIDADKDDHNILPNICSQLRETLFSALKKVFDIMQLTEMQVYRLLYCVHARSYLRLTLPITSK